MSDQVANAPTTYIVKLKNNITSLVRDTNTTTIGTNSNAQGKYTLAYGDYSHAEGKGTSENFMNSDVAIAMDDVEADYNPTEGHTGPTYARGIASHAEGFNTYAKSDYSHAEGYETMASLDQLLPQ